MTWKPTEGIKRAEPIVRRLIEDSLTADMELRDPVFTHHVIAVLGKELDQALADGAEQDAIAAIAAAMVGKNGQAEFPMRAYGVKADGSIGPMTDAEYAAAVHGPVRLDLPDFPAPEPVERMPEDDLARSQAIQAAEQGAAEAFGPKKKRGRPKGSKGKKAKRAKAARKARAAEVADPAPDQAEPTVGEAAS